MTQQDQPQRKIKIIRRSHDIIEAGIASSRQDIYRKIAHDGFPKPIQLGRRSVGWYAEEIDIWLKSRPRADPKSARAA